MALARPSALRRLSSHYLPDLVFGANDGIITTFAVVSGVVGASLSERVIVILGFANLVADGFSMGASNYLGLRSEIEQAGGSVAAEAPWRHGLATVGAFMIVGSFPLVAYVVAPLKGLAIFPLAVGFSVIALLGAGIVRAAFVGKTAWRSAIEMLAVGALAGGAAYLVGRVAASFAA